MTSISNRSENWKWEFAISALAVMLLAITLLLPWWMTADSKTAGEALTRYSIWLALFWYAAALDMMIRLSPIDWEAESRRGRIARLCWTWAVVCFVIHVGLAFHFYHSWSHWDAFERTEQASGFGAGIYVSYLFMFMWIADAVWWWSAAGGYARRPQWIGRALHAMMLFIVFNGMVVFATGPIRWAGIFMFIGLPIAWIRGRSSRKNPAS